MTRVHVASLELCKELHTLSGWDDTIWSWYCDEQRDDDAALNLTEFLKVVGGVGYFDHKYPAYDLGYLLRKTGPGVDVMRAMDSYSAGRIDFTKRYIEDTPEDALARLAIELFSVGSLRVVIE